MLFNSTEFDTYVIYSTVGNYTEPYDIRFAVSQRILLPDHLIAPVSFVLHLFDHCDTVCILGKQGVVTVLSQLCELSPHLMNVS